MSDETVAHESRRCPKCRGHGRVLEFETIPTNGLSPLSDVNRVQGRTLECADCELRWTHGE